MKHRAIWMLVIIILPFLNSCDSEDEPLGFSNPNSKWSDTATLKFTPAVENVDAFEYYIEAGVNGKEYWNTTDLDFNISLELDGASPTDISKIDIYAYAEETDGESFTYLGGEQGKLYETILNPSDAFVLSFSKDKLEELFKNDFSPNHNGQVTTNDIFEFKWVITGKDGSVVDSRVDCFGFNCTYGVATNVIQVAPPIWEGTFDYEWIAATANAQSYGRISVGQTGTMTFTLQPGSFTVYDASHLTADYYYGSAGTLTYDYESGLVEIEGRYAQKWDIVDVSGPTLTIDFSYQYSAGYDEYGTFTLTRTDGQDWPSNIYTN
ncbi:hypothetical protein NO995_16625 [Aestuariibaculum sp. M13]|uniref:hypothetical protein n=1 Tax=Aestuariibaculum sp. M13 TaxID=2967132 RepID=UPI002159D775|nr:hypothetical protein [Aestuariibaculum sp. M13]MCR8669315.1 hypothetical protein [Aestuariibaculum sp. M13]